MQALQLAPEDKKLIFAFNKNVEWLKAQSLKTQPAQSWGDHDEACKILPRSKAWYKHVRLGVIKNGIFKPAILIEHNDWRMIGNRVEYRLAAVESLKKSLTK